MLQMLLGHKMPLSTFVGPKCKILTYEFWVGGGTEGVHLSQAKVWRKMSEI